MAPCSPKHSWPCKQLCTAHKSLEAGRDPGKWTVGCSLWDTHSKMLIPSWLPFLPPVELDTCSFKAIVSVVVDELRVHCRVPHHLPTQTPVWLRSTAGTLGKPLPGCLIPHLYSERPQHPDRSTVSEALLPPHTLCQHLPKIWQAPTAYPAHATRAGGRIASPSLAHIQH